MLSWMGGACLANARRCGRTPCRYTGPFFVGMATAVLAYISGVLPLGTQPWLVLGLVVAVGNALIWWASERMLGTNGRRECMATLLSAAGGLTNEAKEGRRERGAKMTRPCTNFFWHGTRTVIQAEKHRRLDHAPRSYRLRVEHHRAFVAEEPAGA
jgi:hypothetical protein